MVPPSKTISNGSTSLRTSADGTRFASQIARLWGGKAGSFIASIKGHSLRIYCRFLCRLLQPHICKIVRIWNGTSDTFLGVSHLGTIFDLSFLVHYSF